MVRYGLPALAVLLGLAAPAWADDDRGERGRDRAHRVRSERALHGDHGRPFPSCGIDECTECDRGERAYASGRGRDRFERRGRDRHRVRGHSRRHRRDVSRHRYGSRCILTCGCVVHWVPGHFEVVFERRRIPACTERVWVPARTRTVVRCGVRTREIVRRGYWKRIHTPARVVKEPRRVWVDAGYSSCVHGHRRFRH